MPHVQCRCPGCAQCSLQPGKAQGCQQNRGRHASWYKEVTGGVEVCVFCRRCWEEGGVGAASSTSTAVATRTEVANVSAIADGPPGLEVPKLEDGQEDTMASRVSLLEQKMVAVEAQLERLNEMLERILSATGVTNS